MNWLTLTYHVSDFKQFMGGKKLFFKKKKSLSPLIVYQTHLLGETLPIGPLIGCGSQQSPCTKIYYNKHFQPLGHTWEDEDEAGCQAAYE